MQDMRARTNILSNYTDCDKVAKWIRYLHASQEGLRQALHMAALLIISSQLSDWLTPKRDTCHRLHHLLPTAY